LPTYERNSQSADLALRHYLEILRRRKWTFVLVVIFVVGAAMAYTFTQTPMYRSSAQVLLQPTLTEQVLSLPGTGSSSNPNADKTRVATELQVMKSQQVKDAVAERLGAPAKNMALAQIGDTDVVGISSTDTDPDQAAKVAETYAETYVDVRLHQQTDSFTTITEQLQAQQKSINDQLTVVNAPIIDLQNQLAAATDPDVQKALSDRLSQAQNQAADQLSALTARQAALSTQLAQLTSAQAVMTSGGVQIVSKAVPGKEPVSPKPVRNAGAALAVAMVLGLALAFVRDHYDDTLKSKEDVEQATRGLPVLGLIPTVAGWRDRRSTVLVTKDNPNSPPAEAYRSLRTSLEFIGLEHDIGVLQITSPSPGEGKTTTICNLAVSLAKAGRRVVLVDCDLRRPRLHQFFGLRNDIGFTTVLMNEAPLSSAVQPVKGEPHLALVASGEPPPNPSELLSSRRSAEIVAALRAEADFVLLDSPPVLPVADARVLSAIADATVVVVTAGQTSRRETARTVELLEQVDAAIVGVVVNAVSADSGYSYGQYQYGYYGTKGKGRAAKPSRSEEKRRKRKDKDEAPSKRSAKKPAPAAAGANGNGATADGDAGQETTVESTR
jgi:capsular exopolysaccharide synthesis family protein